MRVLKKVISGIKGLWFFFWGHMFLIFYDKKYLCGRWFDGRWKGFNSVGWEWVTKAGFARVFCGYNKNSRYPICSKATVIHPSNIHFHPDNIDNFQSPGVYFQAIGKIHIGHGTYIGPNVGLITANHNFLNLDEHLTPKPIIIGEKCWIGMNSVLLPGVELGDNTIVGAGSVVTRSFVEGYCIIAGNPAKIIKSIEIV